MVTDKKAKWQIATLTACVVVTDLSLNASFHFEERTAPSSRGNKHLACAARQTDAARFAEEKEGLRKCLFNRSKMRIKWDVVT
jgi:hypothetical protein